MNDFFKQYTRGLNLNKNQKAFDVDFVTRVNTGFTNYFYNIPIEGQLVTKRISPILLAERDIQFAIRIVQKGNILSLVKLGISVDKDNFFEDFIFRQLVLSSFWTFDEFFLRNLLKNISGLLYEDAIIFYKFLDSNFYPYRTILNLRGNEYEWAMTRKLPACLRDKKLMAVFKYDYQNRLVIRMELKKHCLSLFLSENEVSKLNTPGDIILQKQSSSSLSSAGKDKIVKSEILKKGEIENKSGHKEPLKISFAEMLDIKEYDKENRLEYIKTTMELAKAKYNIFIPPTLTSNNKNPKGFNGTVAAAISFFYENGFFYKKYTIEDIIEAFICDYKFDIPKYKGKFSFFMDQYDFKDLITRLKKLDIS